MVRQVEVALIPVFQFGVFSQSDLSFFPGPDFDFNGRVQTNGNLFLADESSLTFHTYIRAAGDVVRDQLANGAGTVAQGRTSPVYIPTTAKGCEGAKPSAACRDLTVTPTDEGSSIGGPSPTYGGTGVVNKAWDKLSRTTYASMILSGSTGVRPLTLAFVQAGVDPIEIVRRRPAGEPIDSSLGESRLYNQAQIRVLLSDDPADLPGGAGDGNNVRLANVQTNTAAPDYSKGVTVPVGNAPSGRPFVTYFAEASSSVQDTSAWNATTKSNPTPTTCLPPDWTVSSTPPPTRKSPNC